MSQIININIVIFLHLLIVRPYSHTHHSKDQDESVDSYCLTKLVIYKR